MFPCFFGANKEELSRYKTGKERKKRYRGKNLEKMTTQHSKLIAKRSLKQRHHSDEIIVSPSIFSITAPSVSNLSFFLLAVLLPPSSASLIGVTCPC